MALLISILIAIFLVPWPWSVLVVLAGASVEVAEVVWGLNLAKRWRPQTGAETMIGQRAEVVVACRPTGRVRINGELWEATCAAGAGVGEETIVQAIDGLTLIVDPAPADVHPIGTM
jgi:membrane-bound serine protease (ClpP class)